MTLQTVKREFKKLDTNKIKTFDLIQEVINSNTSEVNTIFTSMYNRSPRNQFIALMCMRMNNIPISPIATYNQWKAKGYNVQLGEKSVIDQCIPTTKTIKEVDKVTGEEKKKTFTTFLYKGGYFALSQTNCKDFSVEQIKIKGYNLNKALDTLKIKIKSFDLIDGNCGGYATTKNGEKYIAINSMNSIADQMHTLFHEIAHQVYKHTDANDKTHRGIAEYEADITAFIVCRLLGIDTPKAKDYCNSYITSWLSPKELKEVQETKSVNKIFKGVQTILKAGIVSNNAETIVGSDL